MITTVVGISFNPTNDDTIRKGSKVSIAHDRDNKYSSKAIAVKYGDKLLGHVGEKDNPQHETIFEVLPLEATVHTISKLEKGESFAKFKVGEITHLEVEFKMASDVDGKIKSFNEDVLLTFLEDSHRYVHEGKDLISATSYIKKWIKPFDKEFISRICAGKYGCTQEEVLGLWGNGGKIAASYGTAIHNALEHYERYKELGAVIQGQKDLPYNKALPSHPALRRIVTEFYQQDLQPGQVIVEALLTNIERGLCGYADRILVTGEKKCRVEDYKININADVPDKNLQFLGQMSGLSKTKLSKYQLQLSFYARLLELSGWQVEGSTIYVYDVKWKRYDMTILKLDF